MCANCCCISARAPAKTSNRRCRQRCAKFNIKVASAPSFRCRGHGIPLAPDMQLQVLHGAGGTLNVRKALAGDARVADVQQQPQWRFEVRDNGRGFRPGRQKWTKPRWHAHHGGTRRTDWRHAGSVLYAHHGSSVVLTLPAEAGADRYGCRARTTLPTGERRQADSEASVIAARPSPRLRY